MRLLEVGCGPLLVDDDGTVLKAHGIPYATAERFAAPIPAPRHREPRDATRRGAACPQATSRLDFVNGPIADSLAKSEQCQVLSVTAPHDAQGLPVMVWFHGGAYMSGSGDAPKYDPDALATEGRVVVVTVSYRLGIFGYLNPDADGVANLGLRDQILALQWTRRYITAFGGDPARVTIFGQSAGADAVLSLMLGSHTAGLFHRAILQSAPLGLRKGREAMTAAMREAVTAVLAGVAAGEATVEQLLDAQTAAVTTAQRFGLVGGFPFAPIAGVDPMPAAGDESRVLADVAGRVEILVGYTRNDADAFVAMDPRGQRLQRLGRPGRVMARLLGQVLTRRIFGGPARGLANFWTSSGGAAATFRVDWSPPGAPFRACHCIELPLLFGTPEIWADAPMLGPGPDSIDTELARRTRGYWAAFAHHGVAGLARSSLRI